VHNWISLNDTPFGTCTWYVEGMAEFYSAVVPWRMGIVTKEELLAELNKRASQFYENPYIHTPNEVLGRNLMSNKEMTRVPYGRGFFYMTHADAEIRKATQGEKCLDDVMQEIRAMFKRDPQLQNDAWLCAYGKIVGREQAEAELANLQNGGEIIPQAECFGGEIQACETCGIQRESGAACRMWRFE
jgi:predicted metalloprotease with PDZ domain